MTDPDERTPEDSGQATEATFFDPFADDDSDSVPVSPTGSDHAGNTDGAGESDGDDEHSGGQSTQATPFDPFADDSDSDEFHVDPAATADPADSAVTGPSGAPGGSSKAGDTERQPTVDSGERSRREALSTFRRRRGTSRAGAEVAGGMVRLPFIPPTNPQDAVISDEAVEKAVSEGTERPVLQPGDMVAAQYEVLGPIAHGGLGWIYLAVDHNVSDRWVVLKGMMATTTAHERAVAESERAFLADITHPGIVKIFNFIDDPRSPGGFIIMEYVGGPSLRHRRRRQPGNTLPIDIAIGYILEVLPALDYLHSRGVVYNDLKPDNIIITEDQVKLIDLGAVSGIGAFGHIFGTRGFQAPEIARTGPTIASDIYTVGRTLASLIVKLPVTDGVYDPGLPTPNDEPLFRKYLSLYRLLLRATDENPERRFSSAGTMANQLIGVLREVLAIRDGRQYPHLDTRFTAQRSTFGTKHLLFRTDQLIDGIERSVETTAPEVVAALPTPLTDPNDPGASLLSAASLTEPGEVLDTLKAALKQPDLSSSTEIPLTIVRAQLDLGMTTEAVLTLRDMDDRLQRDWRHQWLSGVSNLLTSDFVAAQACFNEVLNTLPGEPAPKLALAATDELMLQHQGMNTARLLDPNVQKAALALTYTQGAQQSPDYSEVPGWTHLSQDPVALRFHTIRLYGLVWATNASTVSAAFGLARQLHAEGLVDAAVAALDRLPQSSRHHRMARLTTVLMLITEKSSLNEARLRRAARRLEILPTNEPRIPQVRLAVLAAALEWLRAEQEKSGSPVRVSKAPLFDVEFSERGLRAGIEQGLRDIARQSPFARHRFRLVDMANRIRPRTWF